MIRLTGNCRARSWCSLVSGRLAGQLVQQGHGKGVLGEAVPCGYAVGGDLFGVCCFFQDGERRPQCAGQVAPVAPAVAFGIVQEHRIQPLSAQLGATAGGLPAHELRRDAVPDLRCGDDAGGAGGLRREETGFRCDMEFGVVGENRGQQPVSLPLAVVGGGIDSGGRRAGRAVPGDAAVMSTGSRAPLTIRSRGSPARLRVWRSA